MARLKCVAVAEIILEQKKAEEASLETTGTSLLI